MRREVTKAEWVLGIPPLLEEVPVPGAGFQFLHDVLHDLREEEDDEGDQKEIRGEEIVQDKHGKHRSRVYGYMGIWVYECMEMTL
ncbi:MAG: hypothetical protein V1926_05600 [Candidatus Peregrinibacteria bacterium]